jgi:hypothetical protein
MKKKVDDHTWSGFSIILPFAQLAFHFIAITFHIMSVAFWLEAESRAWPGISA